jgi:SAM-dependent methyltransferase
MTGISGGAALARTFPCAEYKTVVDVGCAEGCVPVHLARAHPHLTGGGFDLPAVRPHFEAFVGAAGLQDRVRFHEGDFFRDPLPRADVLVMGHILHDWGVARKRTLIARAYDALPPGGAFVVRPHAPPATGRARSRSRRPGRPRPARAGACRAGGRRR